MLTFNEQGLLTPADGISATIDELHAVFVAPFPESETRNRLFNEWKKYNRMLRQEIGERFTQWINGSFVTQKLNPKDIDLVIFIRADLYDLHGAVLDNFWSDKWEKEGLDSYIVKVYPTFHPSYDIYTVKYYDEWLERYTKTKPDEELRQFDKGFLIINVT